MKKVFIILSVIFSLLIFNSYSVMGIVFNQVDTTAPVTSITIDQANGNNGWYVPVGGDETTPSVHLSCTDEEGGSGVASIYYKWDNDESFFSSDLSSVDVPITVTGTHYLYYYCVDNSNNQEEEQVSNYLEYDDDLPITLTEVLGDLTVGVIYTSDINVTLTCTDLTSGCELNQRFETVFASLDGSDYTENTDPVLITGEGWHTLYYYSQDVAGNQEEEQTLTFYIGNLDSIFNITALNYVSKDPAEVSFSASLIDLLSEYNVYWDFGDDSSDEGLEVSHFFESEGAYSITASVSDEEYTITKRATATIGYNKFSPEPYSNLEMNFTNLPEGVYTLTVNKTNSTNLNTGSFTLTGNYYEINSTLTNGEFNVTLFLHYNDENNDGIVDGTSVSENNLKVYYWDGSSWILVENPIINTETNIIEVSVNHFTIFSLFGPIQSTNSGKTRSGGGGGGGGGLRSLTPEKSQTVPEVQPSINPSLSPSTQPSKEPSVVPQEVIPEELPPITGFAVLGNFTKTSGGKVVIIAGLGILGLAGYFGVSGINKKWFKKF